MNTFSIVLAIGAVVLALVSICGALCVINATLQEKLK